MGFFVRILLNEYKPLANAQMHIFISVYLLQFSLWVMQKNRQHFQLFY